MNGIKNMISYNCINLEKNLKSNWYHQFVILIIKNIINNLMDLIDGVQVI